MTYFYMYAVMVLYAYVYITFLSLMFNLTFSWNGIIVVFLLFCVQRYGCHSWQQAPQLLSMKKKMEAFRNYCIIGYSIFFYRDCLPNSYWWQPSETHVKKAIWRRLYRNVLKKISDWTKQKVTEKATDSGYPEFF